MIENPNKERICEILNSAKTIAVIGISQNPSKTSRAISDFLSSKGYKVVGVNPGFSIAGNILVYPRLVDIPFDIDIVDVFRRSEAISEIIPDVIEKNPKVLWLQLGIRNDEAVEPVIEKGISVIQDACMKILYQKCKK
ncbi:MAG: hypothetical protein A2V66_12955 [Ignavibacteria bacterium RBG_13_36_8]|nr:MAG: hypothetical protein A2V66_12955 [Ignavibacteria bacterium RBG_13_36_8]